MKRTDKLTNLIAILLFVAFLAYIGAYAYRALKGSTVTAEAMAADISVGGIASGIVVRSETVLTSGEKYIDIAVSDGAKVAVGTQIATAMNSELGMERASRIHALELEIRRMESALQDISSADDLTMRDQNLTSNVSALASAVARHELDDLDAISLNLEALLFGLEGTDVSPEALQQLKRELQSLRGSSTDDTRALTADFPGTFSSTVDGYEGITPDDLTDLTPAKLETIINEGKQSVDGAYGKMITGYRWYFAAVMNAADAANLTVGRTATLNFGRYYGQDVYARVTGISGMEDGNVAVVFRCDTAMADTLAMRTVAANVVFDTYAGIRIPAQAVQTDPETESTFVWCVTAMQLERKDIRIIYCDEDFVIAERGTDGAALREGNTVVVSGSDLYEGKIIS